MNEKYLDAEMDVVEFDSQDVIATSPIRIDPTDDPNDNVWL